MGKRKVRVGEFGPVSGPVTAAGVSLASAGWGDAFGLSPWYAVATAGACAGLTLAMAVRERLPGFAVVQRVATWVAYGSWTWWALSSTPWQVDALASLATMTAVAGVATKAAQVHVRTVSEHQRREIDVQRRLGLAGQWASRVKRVCHIRGDVRVTGVDEWRRPVPGEPGKTRVTGYSLLVELPEGGYRWSDVSSKRMELASDADLSEGCGVEVRQGASARKVVVRVQTVNALGEDVALPEEYGRRSIYDPVRLGLTSDGSYAEVGLKWPSGVLVGQKGSGKSNQLVTVMSQLLRCDDVVVFGIDFNGGGVFKPYLKPWLEGRAQRPAIDWVATDLAEAEKMLNFAVKAIPARKIGYDDLMDEVDDDKVPASADLPHIIVISDESNDLPARVKARLAEISNRGRAASVSTLVCALRAVDAGGNGLPVDINAQAGVKIAMQVDSDAELAYLFNWGRQLKSEEIPGVGYGFYAANAGDNPGLFKGFRTKRSTARDAAEATAGLRPGLDALTRRVDPEVYDQRWERAKQSWLSGSSAAAPVEAKVSGPRASAAPAADASVVEEALSGRIDPLAGTGEVNEAMRRAYERAGLEPPDVGSVEVPDPSRFGVDAGGGDVFSRLVSEQLADVDRGVPFLAAVLGVFDAEGVDEVWKKVLAERLTGGDEERLKALLRGVGVVPNGRSFRMPGRSGTGRGFDRADVERAARGVREGHVRVPEEVAEWRPQA